MFDFFRKAVMKMFPKQSIKQAYGVETAMSKAMLEKISQWEKMSRNTPETLNLPQAICREFANISLNEMTAKISDKRLDDVFQEAISDLGINLQKGLASGAMVIKPVCADKVQYIPQSAFIPIEYNVSGRLVKVIFPEIKKISDFEYYIRLEYHCLDPEKGLTITNRAFYSNSPDKLGKEIPLESVPEWKDLCPGKTYPQMLRPAFGYYVNPLSHSIDGGMGGVSVFDNAIDLIHKADEQFRRLDWEFESAERHIDVDEAAFRDGKIAKIFRTVDHTDLYQEFSPQIRESNFLNGLDEYKRAVEFAVGLSYGDISNPQSVDKTATEIKSAKERKFNTVNAMQKNLKVCLDDLVYALAFYNAKATSNYEFSCIFKDSILTDEAAERQQDLQDLQLGIMRPEEYRAKWYGESIEEALKNLPESTQVIE